MRSDEIVTAFADTLFAQQTAELDTRERGPVVELDLADLLDPARGNAYAAAYDGPPRCARKHAP